MWSDQKDIESTALKSLGAQPLRAAVAAALLSARRSRFVTRDIAAHHATLATDGIVLIPDYLSAAEFDALRSEFEQFVAAPANYTEELISGAIYQRAFVSDLDPTRFPELHRFARDPLLLQLAQANQGQRLQQSDLYVHVHRVRTAPGGRDQNQEAHTDTFHATTKGWLYLHDVAADDGCLWYARGSHRIGRRRLRFEYAKSLCGRGAGSWRLEAGDADVLGIHLEPVPVRANTLVIANTCGFHRRGDTTTDGFRDTIHFSARVSPFRG